MDTKATNKHKYHLAGGIEKEDLNNIKNQAIARISAAETQEELEQIRIELFGRSGTITTATKNLKNVKPEKRKEVGILINEIKITLEKIIQEKKNDLSDSARKWFDVTLPGIKPQTGNLHLVTKAIEEISRTFEKIGFSRTRYPEVEWDYFAFESLNMPKDHAARDEWETFFVDEKENKKHGKMVLTPHTSSGQVREMLRRGNPPIRMINIAKCYRRQSDVSHYPMFHQFEGLVIDEGISIANLKGTVDYFAKNFFGPKREIRLRPYNFEFTEPSFEIDISCDLCKGKGECRMCNEGWLELGGAGMVHPNVLKHGKIDHKKYTGFAFGWGVERTYMMKSGLNIPDIRLLYSSNLEILRQY
jgi:phenylalanyl-tRNA synthetase alpha chain